MTSSWFFLSTLNYDARSTTHQNLKVHFEDKSDFEQYSWGPWPYWVNRGNCDVKDTGLQPLDCWDKEFEYHWGNTCPCPVFVVCCVGRVLCDRLITRPEKPSGFVCVYLIMCDVDTSKVKRPRPDMGRCTTEEQVRTYTVCLLSFMTGIKKSICVKEMTLSLFRFRHRSLVNVHTDLHGHTASGFLCRSRPLQWCLMYLSRLTECP